GTGAMEAAFVNTLSAGDTVVVVRAGKFGDRWLEMATAYGLDIIDLTAPFGHSVPAERLAEALKAHPNVKAVLTQHSESSTGVLNDVRSYAAVTRGHDAILIVDAVSIIVGLREAIRMIEAEGLANVFKRHDRLARATRAGVEALGLELFAKATPSPALTAVMAPRGVDSEKILAAYSQSHNITIAGG